MESADHRPVAIVTGASRDTGRAIAMRLARQGYDLSLAARSEEAIGSLQQELLDQGVSALVTAVDLTLEEDRRHLVSRTLDRMGRVDVLVNNASVAGLMRYSASEWAEVVHQVDLDLMAPMHLTRLVTPHMIERHSGDIVNVLAAGTGKPIGRSAPSATAEAGLDYFTRTLRKELKGSGVSTSSVTARASSGGGTARSAVVASQVFKAIHGTATQTYVDRKTHEVKAFPGIGEKLLGASFPSAGFNRSDRSRPANV